MLLESGSGGGSRGTFDSGQSLVICSFPQTQPDVQHLSANKQAMAAMAGG